MSEPLFRPEPLSFFVPGVPQPGGSKRGFAIKSKATGKYRAVIVEDAKHNAPWRAVVSLAARQAMEGRALFTGALSVSFDFVMPRPKGHFGTGKRTHWIKTSAPMGHTGKPDVTKLIRSTEDALKGIAWEDDSQIVEQRATKMYTSAVPQAIIDQDWSTKPGCMITINLF